MIRSFNLPKYPSGKHIFRTPFYLSAPLGGGHCPHLTDREGNRDAVSRGGSCAWGEPAGLEGEDRTSSSSQKSQKLRNQVEMQLVLSSHVRSHTHQTSGKFRTRIQTSQIWIPPPPAGLPHACGSPSSLHLSSDEREAPGQASPAAPESAGLEANTQGALEHTESGCPGPLAKAFDH